MVRVVLVRRMWLKVEPPSVLTCHCTVGAGLPLAAAVKVAVRPALTVRLVGFARDRRRLVHRQGEVLCGGVAHAVGRGEGQIVGAACRWSAGEGGRYRRRCP